MNGKQYTELHYTELQRAKGEGFRGGIAYNVCLPIEIINVHYMQISALLEDQYDAVLAYNHSARSSVALL